VDDLIRDGGINPDVIRERYEQLRAGIDEQSKNIDCKKY